MEYGTLLILDTTICLTLRRYIADHWITETRITYMQVRVYMR